DLAALLAWADARGGAAGPTIVLAHSMGGCIALRGLLDGALSSADRRPAAAIFSAPMWGLALPAVARPLLSLAARAAVRLGLGRKRARGAASETTYVVDTPFDGNVLVQDQAAWERFRREAEAAPDLTLGSPTLGWLSAAFREMNALAGMDVAGLPPRLVLLGDEEAVVSPQAIRAHAARDSGARLVEIAGARHEPLMEPAPSRIGGEVWRAIDAFLADRAI
ncbi:MAG: alpha/beta hydrolase, partial [Pseudomonadota bacterium]